MITKAKQEALEMRMQELGIREEDLDERFIRGSGSGGQKINKTSSCVWLIHKPSGIEIKCQKERSQAANRFFARRDLCEKMAEKKEGEKSARQQRVEKIRRQKRKRSQRAKNRMLDNKSKQAKKKKLRRRPGFND
ncbi:peptide chain release factor family protein [Verrucomicrobiota bacterium]